MTDVAANGPRLRVLHLAFEDHRRPGSGGGALRSREINTRLARRHDVTSVVATYKGARERVEDGVTYRPLGLNLGHTASLISYHLFLPWYVMRHRADLIVEDFAAPHSSDLVPLFTPCATVAVVQYLFADQKSDQYHLPFWAVERAGVRVHRRFIAVSNYVAERVHALNPDATVEVVYAGVDKRPDTSTARRDVLFLGRLEYEMKGLDLLVDAFSEVVRERPQTRLRIAGDGPHQARLDQRLAERGLGGQVDWLGRISGETKWAELQRAAVVLMPSRFETFGLVALEAMAVGCPVVAFDLPSLQEIAGDSEGLILVKSEDGVGMGRAAAEVLDDPARQRRMSEAAVERAAAFDWDRAALAHERIYRAAVAEGANRSRRARLALLWRAIRALRHGPAQRGRTKTFRSVAVPLTGASVRPDSSRGRLAAYTRLRRD